MHYVRDDPVWRAIQARYSLLLIDPKPAICVVTVGEIRSLAIRFGWGATLRNRMDFLVSYVPHHTIAQEPIYDAYATIEAYSQSIGRPMGKNDLWIAATANYLGARLLTTDRDFDHLAPLFFQLDWIDPTLPASGTP